MSTCSAVQLTRQYMDIDSLPSLFLAVAQSQNECLGGILLVGDGHIDKDIVLAGKLPDTLEVMQAGKENRADAMSS
jgi:hypothetical protein